MKYACSIKSLVLSCLWHYVDLFLLAPIPSFHRACSPLYIQISSLQPTKHIQCRHRSIVCGLIKHLYAVLKSLLLEASESNWRSTACNNQSSLAALQRSAQNAKPTKQLADLRHVHAAYQKWGETGASHTARPTVRQATDAWSDQ